MPLILALDQGTTSSRAIVFDEMGRKLSQVQIPLPQIFPHAGWVEQDAELMWRNQLACARQAIARGRRERLRHRRARRHQPARDGHHLGPRHRRAAHERDRLAGPPNLRGVRRARAAPASAPMVREKTGLPIDPYFSASKIAWMLDNVEGARARAEAGELAFGTVDCWFVWQLTGGAVHATDSSNASRTLLFDIERGVWDDELLALFNVPRALLPGGRALVRRGRLDGARRVRRGDPGRVDHRRPAGGARGQRVLLGGRCEGDVRDGHLRAHALGDDAAALRDARRDRRGADRRRARVRARGLDLHGRRGGAVDRRGAQARRLPRRRAGARRERAGQQRRRLRARAHRPRRAGVGPARARRDLRADARRHRRPRRARGDGGDPAAGGRPHGRDGDATPGRRSRRSAPTEASP